MVLQFPVAHIEGCTGTCMAGYRMATEWLPATYLLPHHANDVWVANEYFISDLEETGNTYRTHLHRPPRPGPN